MQSIIEKNQLIERVHLLIKRKGTGTPEELASRLNVSRATVFRIIETMKEMGAPITYDFKQANYSYEFEVDFYTGFQPIYYLSQDEKEKLRGGLSRYNLKIFNIS